MYTIAGSNIVLGAPSNDWVNKFKEDMIAAGLTDEEVNFQLKDPLFGRGPILCRDMPKEKFAELWNSSVKKMLDAGLTYRNERYMEVRGDEVYTSVKNSKGNFDEYLWIPADYDPYLD